MKLVCRRRIATVKRNCGFYRGREAWEARGSTCARDAACAGEAWTAAMLRSKILTGTLMPATFSSAGSWSLQRAGTSSIGSLNTGGWRLLRTTAAGCPDPEHQPQQLRWRRTRAVPAANSDSILLVPGAIRPSLLENRTGSNAAETRCGSEEARRSSRNGRPKDRASSS